uniref:C2 domain-containing protein n=1 Tax=Trichobilharzia regenti TaxID=157069 RepID=A0AA85KAC4_TRIRE|nr:unnamed protein product [Trichobilharzia regenti]
MNSTNTTVDVSLTTIPTLIMNTTLNNDTSNSTAFDSNPFVINLTKSFHVASKPLAIFLFILVCLACLGFIFLILLCTRTCIRRKYAPRVLRKRPKGIYVDEIPGLVQNPIQHKYGSLEYSLEYSIDREQLRIGVLKASNLVGPNNSESLHPYATITLAKYDGQNLRIIDKQAKTEVFTQTNQPVWNQLFTFHMLECDLNKAVIIFEVFAYDSICQDSSIGKLEVYLQDEDHSEFVGKNLEKTGWLVAGTGYNFGIGELCVGIGYYPNRSRIDVCIYECRQLKLESYMPKLKNRELDILVMFKHRKHTVQRERTHKRKELINPYFNQKISFPLKENNLEQISVVCQLRCINRLRMKHVLGDIQIGMDSKQTTGIKQWEEMVKNPSKMHVMWHSIAPI